MLVSGQLVQHMQQFVTMLRKAGLPLGVSAHLDALLVCQKLGLDHKARLHDGLAACLVKDPRDRQVFQQAFALYWRNPQYLDRLLDAKLATPLPDDTGAQPPAQRLAPRLAGAAFPAPTAPASVQQLQLDARFSASHQQTLRQADFDSLSPDEFRQAEQLVAALRDTAKPQPTRRWQSGHMAGARLDMRASLRNHMRQSSAPLAYKRQRRHIPPLVMILDISGSMARYSRIMLIFAHALAQTRPLHLFAFGTQLSNLSPALAQRDPDIMLAKATALAQDWEGGSRIGSTLQDFNHTWARRVLGQSARVLLVTDGLERDKLDLLEKETQRLSKLARGFVWLNPLLRWEGYQPLARGAAILQLYAQASLPIHSVDSLAQLTAWLASPSHERFGI